MDAVRAVRQRLEQDGFVFSSERVAERDALVGRRAWLHWTTLTRVHVFVFVVAVLETDATDAEQLTAAARAYAVQHKGGLPRGVQTGVASIPVIVVQRDAGDALEWARGTQRRHWASLDLPVVIEQSSGGAAFRDRRDFWGIAYMSQLRRLAKSIVAAAQGNA
jgi:hypothetical protein